MPVGGLLTTGLILGGAQAVMGAIQTANGNSARDKALAKRRSYKTPQEVIDILNATENRAQQGYDPVTLSYLNNDIDRGFSSALGTAERLGADPNDLSALFDQKIQATMQVGAQNHQKNMENFSNYLSALQGVADNKAAEQKSEQDIVKDELQAAGMEIQTGTQNISGGINTGLSAFGAGQTAGLYKDIAQLKKAQALAAPSSFTYSNIFEGQPLQTATGVLPNQVTNINSSNLLNSYTWGG